MASRRVVVTDQVFPSLEIEQAILAEIDAELVVADGTADGVAALAADADALLNTYMPVDRSLVARLPRVRAIARYGIGVDNTDVRAAADAGITVTNVPDYSVEEVAAHTVALMLDLLRRTHEGDAYLRSGGWGVTGLRPIRRISTLTVGLVGYGRIARRVAGVVDALGARVITHDPFLPAEVAAGVRAVDLDELVTTSDVVSIHAPLTPESRGMFGRERIARMRPGSLLINTSRGGLVVLDDVIAALRDGRLGGAALDVFEQEPLDPSRIEGVPRLIATPHMAYYSEESLGESQRKAATQVVKILTGIPPDYPVHP